MSEDGVVSGPSPLRGKTGQMQTAKDKKSYHAVANGSQNRLIRNDAPEWSSVMKQPVREAGLHRCKGLQDDDKKGGCSTVARQLYIGQWVFIQYYFIFKQKTSVKR